MKKLYICNPKTKNMIRQQLTQKQQQKLSPLQIQQIKLLELNSLEIENRINDELEENPALSELTDTSTEDDLDSFSDEYSADQNTTEDDDSLGDYRTEDDIPDYKLQQQYDTSEQRRESPFAEAETFQEFMLNQLHLKNLSNTDLIIGEYIIGNIDDDGYMRRDLESLSDDLAFQYAIDASTEEVARVLQIVQSLDPAGIAATDLCQCLLLQLQRKKPDAARLLAIKILETAYEAFIKNQYPRMKQQLNCSDDNLRQAIREIKLLNPKPGNAFVGSNDTKMAQVTPDFVVETLNGKTMLMMPKRNIPDLCVNEEYNDMLQRYSVPKEKENAQNREALSFIKQKIDAAQWFIDAIKQRDVTLQNVMQALMKIQHDFFLSGDETDIKPMILKDVAERSGYDISTVSRVCNSKYVQTNWGVFPLKFFFSESMTNDEGEEISTKELKSILKACVDAEDKQNPLTDDALMIVLKEKGYDIARRTVAKYREQLNIPVARLRRSH